MQKSILLLIQHLLKHKTLPHLAGDPLPTSANLPKVMVDQQTNIAAKAVTIPDIKFIAKAISAGSLEINSAIQVNILPTIIYKGAPGG